jgi:sterol desaturase/sphingolipid hydroxylase (fatty acid hydroxylase superfamily)
MTLDALLAPLDPMLLTGLEATLESWVAIAAAVAFVLELLRYAWRRELTPRLLGDALTNGVLFAAFSLITFLGLLGVYVYAFFGLSALAPVSLPTNLATVAICVVLADLAYYWEHRASHRINLLWGTHSVHHSSEHYNLSIAYRFGPLDGLVPLAFHAPLLLVGFDPLLVLVAEALVLAYQTGLHTEAIGKLPAPIEWLFNTPSHHRVHHGSNEQYLDTNYGGVLIVWDRLFGTFAAEEERVVYGLTEPLESNGPVWAFVHGYVRLFRRAVAMPRWSDRLTLLLSPPEWAPAAKEA